MAKSILETSEEFIRGVEKRIRELNRALVEQGMGPLTERNGKPITSLRPSELLAFQTLTAQMAAQKDKPAYEIAIELEEDARKSVFILFVLLPIFRSITSSSMLYVAADDMSGPKLDCMHFFIRDQVEFVDLLNLTQAVDYAKLEGLLKGRIVLVDTESDFAIPKPGNPNISYSYLEDKMAKLMRTINAILGKNGYHKIILFQKGTKSLISYPPQFTKASACFIATAACATPNAWEVSALRAFRDETLLRSMWGRLFNRCYCHLSPPLARWIANSRSRQQLVRRFFVTPLASVIARLRR
jgi:hypothetical protein